MNAYPHILHVMAQRSTDDVYSTGQIYLKFYNNYQSGNYTFLVTHTWIIKTHNHDITCFALIQKSKN